MCYAAVAFWLTIIQCSLIHFVKRAMNSQRILEFKYMGPEIIAVQRRNQVAPEPVIHYVPQAETGRVVTNPTTIV